MTEPNQQDFEKVKNYFNYNSQLNIKGAEQLLQVMRKTTEINDFDYNKMMKDFETTSRHEDQLKRIRKKWNLESKKYKETIEHMKEIREESYQHKNAELLKKLKKKDQLLLTSIENVKKDKMKEKELAIAVMIEREKLAKENVEKFMQEQEKLRLKFENDVNEKSKYIINLIFFFSTKFYFT